MLKKILALSAVAVMSLAPACSMVENARNKLANMPEQEYRELVDKAHEAGIKGGKMLVEKLQLSNEDKMLVAGLARSLAEAVATDSLGSVDDVVRTLLERFGKELNNEQVVSILEDATNVLDATLGQIKLGIDGLLSLREKQLLVALLAGVHNGALAG